MIQELKIRSITGWRTVLVMNTKENTLKELQAPWNTTEVIEVVSEAYFRAEEMGLIKNE